MANKGICQECPFAVTLDGGEETAKKYRESHKDLEKTMGGITLTRDCLEVTANKIDCNGPVVTSNGQIDCPLRETTYGVRSMASGTWPENTYLIDLNDIGKNPANPSLSKNPGQYL